MPRRFIPTPRAYRRVYDLCRTGFASRRGLAVELNLNPDTIRDLIDRDPTFKRAVELGYERTKQDLRRTQVEMATGYTREIEETVRDADGNVSTVTVERWFPPSPIMAIHCAKHYLAQHDRLIVSAVGDDLQEADATSNTMAEIAADARKQLSDLLRRDPRDPVQVAPSGQFRDQYGQFTSGDRPRVRERP